MITCLFKGLLSGLAGLVLADYRKRSVELLRIEAARTYLRGVQAARQSVGGLILIGLLISLVLTGALLLHAGLFLLLPWSLKARAVLALGLGLAYLLGGGLALRAALCERAWLERSGAAALLERALNPNSRC